MDPVATPQVSLPTRKLSETILDFGEPMLAQFRGLARPEDCQGLLQIIITIWNAHVMAMPIWGHPEHLAELVRVSYGKESPPQLRAAFDQLSLRRMHQFEDDPRIVGQWEVELPSPSNFLLRCETRIPAAYSPPPPG